MGRFLSRDPVQHIFNESKRSVSMWMRIAIPLIVWIRGGLNTEVEDALLKSALLFPLVAVTVPYVDENKARPGI